jgi:hypothetical protein
MRRLLIVLALTVVLFNSAYNAILDASERQMRAR